MISVIIGLIAGAASTYQASVNTRIRDYFRTPYLTGMLSFIVSGCFLIIVILAAEGNLYIPLGAIAGQPLWIWGGGVCGMAIITLNIICLPKLGSAGNVMVICLGQTLLGLVIDQWGLFYSAEIHMDLKRLLGAVLVIGGMAVFNGMIVPKSDAAGRIPAAEEGKKSPGRGVILYVMLAMLCGFACAAQIAVNGALKDYAGSAMKATLISMIIGFISISVLILILTIFKGRTGIFDDGMPPERFILKPWMVFGGLLATAVVGGNAVAAPVIGTGLVAILNLVGMMGAGLIIDATGFLGISKQPVTASRLAGMILMISGAAVISLL